VRSVLLSAPEVGPPHKLRRETVLFRQQQDGEGLFLVESGLVKLARTSTNGSKLILSVIGSHQLVGDESLALGQSPCLADVICLTEVTGYHIPISAVRRLFGIPDFAAALLSYAMMRDRERVNRIELLALYDVETRVLHGLAELARLVKPNPDGLTFPIPMTQVEIANFIGATRETTSTTLSNLQNRRLLTLGRRLVTTVHPNMLIDAANDKLTRPLATSKN
jgi:CRP/FNR family transcriptional regulator, cyclic AMP receptor protein